MANKKISQLTVGGKLLPGDLVPVARGGTNVSVLGSDLLGSTLPPGGSAGQVLRKSDNGPVWADASGITGLPYLFTGPGKYQYWRVGVKSEVSNTTALWEIILSRGTTGVMPVIANRTQNWPIEWTDGNPETGTGTATFGNFTTETIDFGTAVSIDTIRLNGLASVTQLVVEYSADKVTWFDAYRGGITLVEHVEKAFPLTIQYDTYQTTYNLTADPTKNIGKVLKVNVDGTGFDYTPALPTNGTKGQILRLGDNGVLTWTKEADQVTGLPYRFTGPGKFQYWRVSIASQSSGYTRISELVLCRGANGTMPPIANRTQNWPVQWTDGNTTESTDYITNGTPLVETFDFGTAVVIDYIRINLAYSFYSIKVEYSADQVSWAVAYSANPEGGAGGLPFSAPLGVALDTYLTTYNLTADPTANLGKVLKVNADGTGFDFTDVSAGAQGPAGPQGPQGIQGPVGPAGPAGDGSGGTGGKVKIYLNTNVITSIGPGETEAYSVTITPRAGSTLDIDLGSLQPNVLSSPTQPGSGFAQVETRVYRNGVLLTNQASRLTVTGLPVNGRFVEENSGTDPITFRVVKVYARYNNDTGQTFVGYDTYGPVTNVQFTYAYKIVEYP